MPQQFEAEAKQDKYYSAMMSISLQQSTRLHEMKWMRDVRSTKKLDLLYHPNCSHLTARGGKIFLPFFRCIVVMLSLCCHQQSLCCHQHSLLGRHADVLPLLFVVSLSLIFASGRYLLALQSCGAFSTTSRLNGDWDFRVIPSYCHVKVVNCC